MLGCLAAFFINAGVTQIPCLRDICRLDRFVFPDMTTPPRVERSISDTTLSLSPSSLARVFGREDRTVDKGSHPCRLQPLQNESGRRPRGRPAARQTDTFDHRRPAVATRPPPSGRPPPPSPRWSGARREERGSDRCGAHDRREPGVGRAAGDRLRVLARRDQTLVRARAYYTIRCSFSRSFLDASEEMQADGLFVCARMHSLGSLRSPRRRTTSLDTRPYVAH